MSKQSYPHQEQLDAAIEHCDNMHSYIRDQLITSSKETKLVWSLILSEY